MTHDKAALDLVYYLNSVTIKCLFKQIKLSLLIAKMQIMNTHVNM